MKNNIKKENDYDENQLENLDEMDNFLDRYQAPKLNQGQISDLNSPISPKEVEAFTGYECRATVLGYVQRGGTPTPEDRLLAARLGKYSVDLLKQGVTGVAVGVRNNLLVNTPIE